ncbi:hypothetical protein [Kineosporia babensis]|uniref:Uncharacterized protein n=1 Tax=Kineosporia babensis TaxID=499548 RepID=A0A9X1N6Y7_9ACTN|nr:hypothetical protein [Kineosporia babensis]MCD5309512.1 hypothetical protein [Kineosporia babensis]
MTALLMSVLFGVSSALILTGFLICAEYRWVGRCEYRLRCRWRTWDAYWPIEVPAELSVPLY